MRPSVFLLATVSLSLATARKCYWKTGMLAEDEQEPCFPNQPNSHCCGTNKSNGDPNDICLTNGLCLAQVSPYTGLVLQNGCTDRAWESKSCSSICPDAENFGVHVLPCTSISNKHWCCSASGKDCCDNAFEMDMGVVMLPNSTDLAAPSASIVGTKTTTATATATVTAMATATVAADANSSNNQTTTMGVGVGVGVGLGVCLAATLFGLWFQRRLYRRKLEEMQSFNASQIYFYSSSRNRHPVELPPNHKPTVYELGGEEHGPEMRT